MFSDLQARRISATRSASKDLGLHKQDLSKYRRKAGVDMNFDEQHHVKASSSPETLWDAKSEALNLSIHELSVPKRPPASGSLSDPQATADRGRSRESSGGGCPYDMGFGLVVDGCHEVWSRLRNPKRA